MIQLSYLDFGLGVFVLITIWEVNMRVIARYRARRHELAFLKAMSDHALQARLALDATQEFDTAAPTNAN